MNRTYPLLLLILLGIASPLAAQEITNPTNTPQNADGIKYQRSSLYTLLLDNASLPNASLIKEEFLKIPIPDKFNDHNLAIRSTNISNPNAETIASYLNQNNVAKQLVAKWFNRSPQGGFNMKLVAERGYYNASEMDASIAKSTAIGLVSLGDAGVDLITSSFVLVSSCKYVQNEEIVKKSNMALAMLSRASGNTLTPITNVGTQIGSNMDRGYLVKSSAHLYQLVWNDSIETVFYKDYWTTDATIDLAKVRAFDQSNLFTLKYIGTDVSSSSVLSSSKFTHISESALITRAERRSIDKVIAKLQKKHEVFRTKTPLYTANPPTAKIGTKEGLEKGDKYEVLEQTLDSKGKIVYKRVGVIKVDASQIWQNEYLQDEEAQTGMQFNRTLFKVESGKFYAGMLIRQL